MKRVPKRHLALAVVCVVAPAATFFWLRADVQRNQELVFPTEHFLIVTVVSLLALGVAVLVALQMEQYSVALVALGFMSMAGFFAVHALSTPGVPLHGMGNTMPLTPTTVIAGDDYSPATVSRFDYSGTVIGISAFLSLFVPAVLFAAASTPVAIALLRRLPAHTTVVGIAAFLAGYAFLSGARSDLVAGLPLSRAPYSYALALVTIGLLAFAAWQHARVYLRSRFPTHGALVVAYVLLAEAQVLMATAPFWSLAWWEYHVAMLGATILALGALVVELRRRRALERFLPPPVVERVVAGDLSRLLAGDRRVVTILFADLRGSTALAEYLDPQEFVGVLNDYVGALAQCVLTRGGMVRQFLGDGLMAIFSAFEADASSGATQAVQATLDMRLAVRSVNDARSRQGGPVMRFGVGIHTGEVILGSIGIRQQAEITAFGDTVNTASRLQDLSKQYGVDSVLSAQTAAQLNHSDGLLRSLGPTAVRGRQQPVEVYTLAE